MSAYPSATSTVAGGVRTSRTVAPSTTPSVPSVPDERLGDIEATLRQQMLQRVAGHLPPEPAELRTDRRQIARHHVPQRGQRRRGVRRRPIVERQPLAGAGDHVEGDHVVRRTAVAKCARTACVVADHAAERAAIVGRRVRSEAQSVRPGRALQVGQDDARLDPGGAAPPGRSRGRGPDAGRSREPARCRPRCPRSTCRHRGTSTGHPSTGTRRGRRRPRRPSGETRRPAAPRGRARRRSNTPRAGGSSRRPRPDRPGATGRQGSTSTRCRSRPCL